MSSSTHQTLHSPPAFSPEPDPTTPDLHSAFICTICWQSQPRGSKPKLLGNSARIVCRACWRAVLDLSICWVCGECIVRGDEVVSLGWCFWHRACFGCLVCGTKLDVPAGIVDCICQEGEGDGGKTEVDRRGEWGRRNGNHDEAGVTGSTRCVGVELEDIPLCTVCEDETLGESPRCVLERGLETVTKSDGGLSRSRLDMLSEGLDDTTSGPAFASRSSSSSPRRTRGKNRTEESLRSFVTCRTSNPSNGDDTSPLLRNAGIGISEDGSADERHSHSDIEARDMQSPQKPADQNPAKQETASDIVYVSVLDPLGEPAFRPSRFKPLPKWMNLLPTNVQRRRQRRIMNSPELAAHLKEPREGSGSYASDGADESETDTLASGSITAGRAGSAKRKGAPSSIELPTKVQKRATIAFDPTPRGDDLPEDAACMATRCAQSSLEFPCSTSHAHPCTHPSRPSTPYPRSPYPTRPSLSRNETTSYFSHRSSVASIKQQELTPPHSTHFRPGSPESERTISPMKNSLVLSTPGSMIDFAKPSYSSEYLDRYQPKPASQVRYEKHVPREAEPILENIKRRVSGDKDGGEASMDGADGGKKEKDKGKGKGFMLGSE
ncbi:hypothetical protein WAI453_001032 [Rhynchosporium graminicola]